MRLPLQLISHNVSASGIVDDIIFVGLLCWVFCPRPITLSPWASECPDVKNYKWRHNSVWHRMLYICTHKATVGVRGLITNAVVGLTEW